MAKLVVYKGRMNTVVVTTGLVLTGDTITSQIRERPDNDAALIASWTVITTQYATGIITITLDDTSRTIAKNVGWMDFKRVHAGVTTPLFDIPLEVEFRKTVTV